MPSLSWRHWSSIAWAVQVKAEVRCLLKGQHLLSPRLAWIIWDNWTLLGDSESDLIKPGWGLLLGLINTRSGRDVHHTLHQDIAAILTNHSPGFPPPLFPHRIIWIFPVLPLRYHFSNLTTTWIYQRPFPGLGRASMLPSYLFKAPRIVSRANM